MTCSCGSEMIHTAEKIKLFKGIKVYSISFYKCPECGAEVINHEFMKMLNCKTILKIFEEYGDQTNIKLGE